MTSHSQSIHSQRRRAVFLDRDGVVNVDTGFAHRSDQIIWVEGAVAAVQHLNQLGYLVFVVTNQSGIARGLYTEDHVRTLHDWMRETLSKQGARIDDFAYCPHHPDGTVVAYQITCDCRKPAPGLLHQLMNRWPVDVARSFMVGDRDSDISAAKAAGIAGYLFRGGDLRAFIANIVGR